MIAPGPTLTTARLILRPTAREDFDGWAELMADPENSGFIGGPQERPAAWRGMMSMAGAWALEGYAMFSVLDRETGEWLGRIGPWVPEGWPGTEVGWALLKKAWGKGYAVEAAEATIDWAFDTLGWTEVIHTIAPDNVASQLVAKRLGSTNNGPTKLPPPYEHMPVDSWGQTREQWRARVR
ncbi:MAG TPA: GNAT family N-acetyltransferase [Caulobacter sp.]|nr:GNAT family N-acetyltransferase [Caulobacter sp.]